MWYLYRAKLIKEGMKGSIKIDWGLETPMEQKTPTIAKELIKN
jgi:hypothetical protein